MSIANVVNGKKTRPSVQLNLIVIPQMLAALEQQCILSLCRL